MEEKVESPHAKDLDVILDQLDSDVHGLSNSEAEKRFAEYGPNEIRDKEKISLLGIVFSQFKSWLVIILIAAAIISWIVGQRVDFWVITIVIIVNAIIGFSQEYRAEKAIASLKEMIVKESNVLRDGKEQKVESSHLVPGDIMLLEEGDNIAADGRIIASNNFRTAEASLTGESTPISKTNEILDEDTALADRKNMVWKGTFVAGGNAKIIITGTGSETAIGDISESIQKIEHQRTNFMLKTDRLAKKMTIISISSAILIFSVGYFYRDFKLNEILLASIAALVAAVPEGLPAIITVVLAIGARRMAKKNAVVREFTVTETLGVITVILTDKTGTLTKNSLTVKTVFIPGEKEYNVTGEGWDQEGEIKQQGRVIKPKENIVLEKLLLIAALSNNAEINKNSDSGKVEIVGDPTEAALLILANKAGVNFEEYPKEKLDDFPFDTDLRLRATAIKSAENNELFVTGAPEELLKRSKFLLTAGGETALSEDKKNEIKQKIVTYSDRALRIIALAYKNFNAESIEKENIDELTFVGLVGMIDPLRPESKEAVKKCKLAGIRVIMLTGDHLNTAVAIAQEAGIISEEGQVKDLARTGKELQNLGDEELDEVIKKISVFARLTPDIKLKIADRLQKMGNLIAMTGDGVNDAPALKKADVGIAMGIMGTDVARDSSDVVLMDDNFATIVNAVREGRIVFTNARQASFFLVTTNIAESITLLLGILLGLPLILTATQILWLNLVTDGIIGLALATEKGHGNIMKKSSALKNENILNKRIIPFLIIVVSLMTFLSIATYYYYYSGSSTSKAQTAVFLVLSFTQLFNIYNLRNINKSLFEIGFFTNRYLTISTGISLLLAILLTEIPEVAAIFHFESLDAIDLLVLFLLSSSILWVVEIYKLLKRKQIVKI